jgi:hypothetical protein
MISKLNWTLFFGMVFTISIIGQSNQSKKKQIYPCGTYNLISKISYKNGEKIGKYGTIQVKPISADKIIMSFFVNSGFPTYNSGSFIDTLIIENNIAIYKIPEYDPSCQIKFSFSNSKILISETTEDYYMGCGFGSKVRTDGFQFKKISSKIPKIKDFTTGKVIEY